MADPMTRLLNDIVKKLLPKLNQEISSQIRSAGLDPYPHVASGREGGSAASASYAVGDLRGLSSLEITKLVVQDPVHASGESLAGSVEMAARLNSDLTARVQGKAKALFINVGVSGKAKASGVAIASTGDVQASTKDGKICLDDLDLAGLRVGWKGMDVHIDNLGPLNALLDPLTHAILTAVKSSLENVIAGAVQSAVNKELDKLMPQCTTL